MTFLASGCGSQINLGNASKQVATVKGAIWYEGGPLSASGQQVRRGPESGTVTIVAKDGGIVTQERLHSSGFEFAVKPGEYTVRAESGDADCQPVHVRAQLARTTEADVICGVL